MVVELNKKHQDLPLQQENKDIMSVNLSPCMMSWQALSPSTYKEEMLSPSPSGPGGVLGSPTTALGGSAGLPGLSPAVSPFSSPTTTFNAYFKGDSPTLPAPSTLLGSPSDDSALNLIYKDDDVQSDEDSTELNNNNSNSNNNNNASNEQLETCNNQDENANCMDNCSPKKTLTTLETIKSPSASALQDLGSPSHHGLGGHNPHVEHISPTYLANGGTTQVNGFSTGLCNGLTHGLNNGYNMLQNGLSNGLCSGYGTGMNGGGSNGGYMNGYYTSHQGAGGPAVHPPGYGTTNRSCAVSSNPYHNQGMSLGCNTSPLQPCDLSLTGCSLSSPPPSLSPISPSSFTSNSCMYSAWRSGGLTAVAAAASGITGALSPAPSTNSTSHPYLHGIHNGYSSGASDVHSGGGQGSILGPHTPSYPSSLVGSLPQASLSYSAPTPPTPTVSLHSSFSDRRHSLFVKGNFYLF